MSLNPEKLKVILTSIREAIINAGRLVKEGGCDVVKLEGGVHFAPTVEAIVKAGIPVQGHIGLTPQTASALGGFKMQGKDATAATPREPSGPESDCCPGIDLKIA